jgi:SnoaL-like domain
VPVLRFSLCFAKAIAVIVGLGLSAAGAQSNTAAVISASAALSKVHFAAMDKVWAHESYVFYIGPFHRSVILGWPAVQAEPQASKANVGELSIKPFETSVRIDGDTVWLIGKGCCAAEGRHVRKRLPLYYAGQAKNWGLAAFELNELRGALARRTIPTHRKTGVDTAVASIFADTIKSVDAAIKAADAAQSATAYG